MVDGDSGRNRLRVLEVEDQPATAQTTALLLRAAGFEVLVAPDGPTALRLVEEADPDVVLLDLALPGLDGYEVARRVRGKGPRRTPLLVAVTGLGSEADRRRSEEAGIDLHLVKPVDPDGLRRLLARFGRVVLPADGDT